MKNKLALVFIFIVGFFIYLATVRGVWGNLDKPAEYGKLTSPTQPFESSHERSPYVQSLEIYRNGKFNLNLDEANFASPDVGYTKNGKFFSYFPPGVPFIILPFRIIGQQYNLGQVFSYMGIALFAVFSLMCMFKILRDIFGLPVWSSLAGVMIYGFATTSWSFSNTIYQHAITVFLFLSMFYSVWKYKKGGNLSWLWGSYVWLGYAFSFIVDYPNALLLLPIMVYFLLASFNFYKLNDEYKLTLRSGILVTFIVFLVAAAWIGHFDKVNFGSYLQFSNTLPRYDTSKLGVSGNTIATSTAQSQSNSNVFKESLLPNGFYELTVATDKGLFYFSPILLLAFLGFYKYRRKITLELGIIITFVILNVLLYASFGDPWGGWAFGPRYVIPAMAGLSLIAALGIGSLVTKIITLILFMYSSSVALLGALTTDTIPPKIEAVYDKIPYGLKATLMYFKSGKTGSFIYNNYFSGHISLFRYFFVIEASLCVIMIVILFVIPAFENEHTS